MSEVTPDEQLWTRTFLRLFALIIGIDKYESEDFPPLDTPVRDVCEYKGYLTEYLGVPESQICALVGRDASHDSIIDSLASLQNDPRINVGDPIFIFFAGHSHEASTSSDCQSGPQCYVQSLVPQDYCKIPGLEIPCIPDSTIAGFIESIARNKGNNITVVLDCCHPSSDSRGINSGIRIRSAIHKQNPNYASCHPIPRFRSQNPRSHILITACTPSVITSVPEPTRKFSTAFLQLLQTTPPDKLRYSQIQPRMTLTHGIKPHIEGLDLDKFLFGARPLAFLPQDHRTQIFFDEASGSCFVKSGTAHGVTVGTTFDVNSDTESIPTKFGTLVVEKAMSFYSMVKICDYTPRGHLSQDLRSVVAIQRHVGKRPHQVGLYITHNHRYQFSETFLCSLLADNKYNLCNVALVDYPNRAHLEVSINRSRAIFQLLDQRAVRHGFHHRYPRVDTDNDKVASFLGAACNFFWELDRTADNVPDVMAGLELTFRSLDERRPTLSDSGAGTLDEQDLCLNGEIDIVVGDQRHFGIKITNNSDRDLYPVLQYFDCRNLSFPETYYSFIWRRSGSVDTPLKAAGGFHTIGYGSDTADPIKYHLEDGQELAVGFLKLFVFTRPLDLSKTEHNIDQHMSSSSFARHSPATQDMWDTRVIPIIQRRNPKQITGRPVSWPHAGSEVQVDPHIHPLSGRTTSLTPV